MAASTELSWISQQPVPADATDVATYCVICNHNCGIRVDVADGRITKVRPDASNPFSAGHACHKAASIPFLHDHPQRVRHPLRRCADGLFERVTWDTAISEIAARLRDIHERHGARAIGAVGMGGQGNHLGGQPYLLLLEFLGSKRWFCAYAQEKTQHHLIEQWMFDAPPTMMFMGDAEHAAFVLSIGSNPKVSNLMRNHPAVLRGLAKAPERKLVVIDPRVSDIAKDADRHIALRPGTDVYLLLAMAATIVERGLLDHAWLAQHAVGFEEVRRALAAVDVGEMARRCDVEVDAIVQTAVELATAPGACIEAGLGTEHVWFSTLVSYLVRLLLAMTGNAGRPGGQVFIGNLTPTMRMPDRWDEPPRTVAAGIRGVRALTPFHMFSPTLVPEEIQTDHPERLRALVVDSSNPLIAYSDEARWRRALRQLDLLVVVDNSMTETARLADFVLPAAGAYQKWEYSDFPKTWPAIVFQLRQPIVPVEAGADVKAEPEIYVRIARAMGVFGEVPATLMELGRDALTARGAEAFLMTAQALVAELGDANPMPRLGYWAYEAVGPHLPSPAITPVWVSCMLNGLLRPEVVRRSLGTDWREAGPFELGLAIFQRILDHPEGVEIGRLDPEEAWDDQLGWADKKIRLAPEPMMAEIARAIATDLSTPEPDYPYVLSVGVRTRWTANAIHRNPEWRKGRGPHCTLHLSAEDARGLGVASGDPVRVTTRTGSLTVPAEVERGVRPGHAWLPNGFGMSHAADGSGEHVVGVSGNVLTDAGDRDPITGCPHQKTVRCRIEPAAAS